MKQLKSCDISKKKEQTVEVFFCPHRNMARKSKTAQIVASTEQSVRTLNIENRL